jgi:hypothetical protein
VKAAVAAVGSKESGAAVMSIAQARLMFKESAKGKPKD